jgi:hypothetical protein
MSGLRPKTVPFRAVIDRLRRLHPRDRPDIPGIDRGPTKLRWGRGRSRGETRLVADALGTALFGPQDYAVLDYVPSTGEPP